MYSTWPASESCWDWNTRKQIQKSTFHMSWLASSRWYSNGEVSCQCRAGTRKLDSRACHSQSVPVESWPNNQILCFVWFAKCSQQAFTSPLQSKLSDCLAWTTKKEHKKIHNNTNNNKNPSMIFFKQNVPKRGHMYGHSMAYWVRPGGFKEAKDRMWCYPMVSFHFAKTQAPKQQNSTFPKGLTGMSPAAISCKTCCYSFAIRPLFFRQQINLNTMVFPMRLPGFQLQFRNNMVSVAYRVSTAQETLIKLKRYS